MPVAIDADWTRAEANYAKGVPLSTIAKEQGISLAALRGRAVRYKWTQRRVLLRDHVSQVVTDGLAERAKSWISQIDTFVHAAMANLEPKGMPLAQLERAVSVASTLDQMARRTYQLDQQPQRAASTLVNIQVHSGDVTLREEKRSSEAAAPRSGACQTITLPDGE